MKVTFILALVSSLAIFAVFIEKTSHVSIREIALYQGYYPVSKQTAQYEVGDILAVDLRDGGVVNMSRSVCNYDPSNNSTSHILERQFEARVGAKPTSALAQDLSISENSDVRLSVKIYVMDPIRYMTEMFSTDALCERRLAFEIGDRCMLVVKGVVYAANKKIGFDTTERCQLVSADRISLDAYVVSSSFDENFGVSFIERQLANYIGPIVGIDLIDIPKGVN